MDRLPENRSRNPHDTAMYVRVKRYDQSLFIVCDDFEPVHAVKARLADTLNRLGIAKREEPL